MEYYNCEPPSSMDFFDFGEIEWNHPPLMPPPPPRKTLTSVYGNSAQFFPGYSRNMYSYRLNRQREFHPFNHKQFSKKEIIHRRPYRSHDWNFPVKNVPSHAGRYNSSMIPLACSPPYNLRSRFNLQSTQTNNDEFQLQNYSNELVFQNNAVRMQNILHREPEYPEMQNFGNCNMPPDMWDNSTFQSSSDPSFNQTIPINKSQRRNSGPLRNVHREILCSPIKKTEIPSITYPQQCSPSIEPIISSSSPDVLRTAVDNSLKIETVTEEPNPSLTSIQEQNTLDNEVLPEALDKTFDYMDETALSSYFLNDLYPSFQTEDQMFEFASNSQSVSSNNENDNILEEITINSLEHENFFDEINDLELKITNANGNKESGSTNCESLTNNLDSKAVTEDIQFRESTDKANTINTEISGYSSENSCVNCFENKHSNDNTPNSARSLKVSNELGIVNNVGLTNNLGIKEVEDSPLKRNTDIAGLSETNIEIPDSSPRGLNVNCSESKKEGKNNLHIFTRSPEIVKIETRDLEKRQSGSNSFDDKVNNYSAEQKFIFHAPVININHQNQISTSRCNNDKILLEAFDSKLSHNLGNDIMKLLCSLQNGQTVKSNSDVTCPEEESCLSTRDNCILALNEKDTNTKGNSVVLNSASGTKELAFMYSNVLDSKISPNQIETSLSSVTNYVLEEPIDSSFKHCKFAPGSDGTKYSLAIHKNENLEKNSELLRMKREKNERKSTTMTSRCNQMRPSSPVSPYLTSDNTINSSMELLDHIFESDSPEYSSDFQATPKKNPKHSKKKPNKLNWKKWKQNGKRRVQVNPRSVSRLPNFFSDDLKFVNDSKKSHLLNQNSKKLYRDAFCQTFETELSPLSEAPTCKQDAQTQWNISDINLEETFENSKLEGSGDETSSPNSGKSLCEQDNIMKGEKEVECKSEYNKCSWNLRPRRLALGLGNTSCSETRNKNETNRENATCNPKMISDSKSVTNLHGNLSRDKKIPSETKNRPSKSKVNAIAAKKHENHNFPKKKQNKKVHTCRKITSENLSHINQRDFHKRKDKRMLANLQTFTKVSSISVYAERKTKTSKPKRNRKKY